MVEESNDKAEGLSPNLSYEEIENELKEDDSEEENIAKNEFDVIEHKSKASDYEKLKYICAEDK